MKKTILFIALAVSSLSIYAKPNVGYVGYFWSNSEPKPIIHPIIFNSKQECEKEMQAMNEITQKTIKVTRQYECQNVLLLSK